MNEVSGPGNSGVSTASATAGGTTNPYVFIVGCPRSGTTLLRRMVDAHSSIAIIPELGWLASRYERRDGLTPDGRLTADFVGSLPAKGGFGRYTPLPVPRSELQSLIASGAINTYAEFASLLFERYGERQGKALVGNKTVDHARSIPTLHALWPRAKFVHLIRDGRDVVLSANTWRRVQRLRETFRTWEQAPIMTAALWWEWHVRLAREAAETLPDLYYELRYESLVAQPEQECRALCDFLGVIYDDAMLRFYEGRSPRNDATNNAKHAWLPPTPGLRDWRSQMAPPEVAQFEAIAGDLLDDLGYARAPAALSARGATGVGEAARIRAAFEGRPLPARSPKAGASQPELT